MNERIRELANQAGFHVAPYEGINDNNMIKKFAELIVGECTDRIRFCIKNDIDFIAEHVEKHFGVEE
jgi:predicted RNA-binding protein with PUA domain